MTSHYEGGRAPGILLVAGGDSSESGGDFVTDAATVTADMVCYFLRLPSPCVWVLPTPPGAPWGGR